MKVLRRSTVNPMKEANNEVTIMQGLEHENIIKCYGSFVNKEGEAVIVLEKGEKPLLTYLRERYIQEGRYSIFFFRLIGRPTIAFVKDYALQICYAVKYLHDRGISHGDLCVGGMIFILTNRLKTLLWTRMAVRRSVILDMR